MKAHALLLAALLIALPAGLVAPVAAAGAPADVAVPGLVLDIPCATPVDCLVEAFLCQLHPLHLCLG